MKKVGAVLIFAEGSTVEQVQARLNLNLDEVERAIAHATSCDFPEEVRFRCEQCTRTAKVLEKIGRLKKVRLEHANVQSFNPDHGEPVFYIP